MLSRNVETFLGCESEYRDARAVVFGAPFDSTVSFRPGSRFAPGRMRAESDGLETYSPRQDRDLSDCFVFDGGDLELPFGDPKNALARIEEYAGGIFADGKLPVMIGGEHLVTLGAVRAAARRYPDLAVVHFDAHADLRDEYLGASLSHATVLRRVWDLVGDGSVFQFGIRSGDRSEFLWGKDHVSTVKFGFEGLSKTAEKLRGRPVYFTLDLDVLDPSVLPGTGTPEPGGATFQQLLEAVLKVSEFSVVGCDVVELCPLCDQSGASTAAACKILRELLLALVPPGKST